MTVRSFRIDGSYGVERSETGGVFEERWTKLGLLANGELGETKVARPGYIGVASKLEIDLANHAIIQKSYRPGVANPDISESRAGVVVRETHGADGSILTRTAVDALGRPQSETLAPTGRTTTY